MSSQDLLFVILKRLAALEARGDTSESDITALETAVTALSNNTPATNLHTATAVAGSNWAATYPLSIELFKQVHLNKVTFSFALYANLITFDACTLTGGADATSSWTALIPLAYRPPIPVSHITTCIAGTAGKQSLQLRIDTTGDVTLALMEGAITTGVRGEALIDAALDGLDIRPVDVIEWPITIS